MIILLKLLVQGERGVTRVLKPIRHKSFIYLLIYLVNHYASQLFLRLNIIHFVKLIKIIDNSHI